MRNTIFQTMELYEYSGSCISIYVNTHFSIIQSLRSVFTHISLLLSGNTPSTLLLNRNFLPFSRCEMIQHINEEICLNAVRRISQTTPSCFILWIHDPELYIFHNYIQWEFLVFDYAGKSTWDEQNFKTHVFPKKLIFVYTMGKNKHTPSLFAVHKTDSAYRMRIWEYIKKNSLKK